MPNSDAMKRELAELFGRDLGRLVNEIRQFPDEDLLWRAAPGVTNPAGNLALHLEGNLRMFIGKEMAGVPYDRDREHEFSGSGYRVEEILDRLEPLVVDVPRQIEELADEVLERTREMDGEVMTNRLFLFHLYGHLRYHSGQINYLRRILTAETEAAPRAGVREST